MWKYEVSNTDHTLMQGVECVNRLLLGEPEATIGIKYESTLDGRNAANHERSHLAGSGDPKRAAAAATAGGSSAAKASPDASAPAGSHHGQHARAGGKSAKAELSTVGAGHSDVGDKDEVHTSEEELGVTTPRKEGAQ
jgi:hypothetical protein